MKTQQMQGLTLAISFDLVRNGSPDEMIHLQKLKEFTLMTSATGLFRLRSHGCARTPVRATLDYREALNVDKSTTSSSWLFSPVDGGNKSGS